MKHPLARCKDCPLLKRKMVGGRGPEDARIAIVGEAPGRTEVREGEVFIGPSGKLLTASLDAITDEHPRITNAALCYARRDTEKDLAAEYCRARLLHEIKYAEIVVALGNTAMHSLIPGTKGSMTKNRGRFVYSEELNKWVLPTWHPAAVLRNPDAFTDFYNDLEKAIIRGPRTDKMILKVAVDPSIDDLRYAITQGGKVAVIDLETSGFDYFTDRILCAVITVKDSEHGIRSFILTEDRFNPEYGTFPYLKVLIEHEDITWIGHNAKFDETFLRTHGFDIRFGADTMYMHYVIDERHGHGLKELCGEYFDMEDWQAPIDAYLRKIKSHSYADVPKDMLYRYAAQDGAATYMLYEHLLSRMDDDTQWVLDHLMIPGIHALSVLEENGVLVDIERMQSQHSTYQVELDTLERRMQDITGDPEFNPRSFKQVQHWLYDEYGLYTHLGRTTNIEALTLLKGQHPLVDTLIQYRKLHKEDSTYILGWLKHVNPTTGRIHANFNLHTTVTGRLSCTAPNLQNLKRDMEYVLVATPGCVIVQADYSQIELRVATLLSQDDWFLDVYASGGDVHSAMAEQVFGPGFTKEQRVVAKGVNFGLIYGRGVQDILDDPDLHLTREEAEEISQEFFSNMPGVVQWIDDVHDFVSANGYVRTMFGRRRRFPLITYQNQSEVFRQAVNTLCQSAASDIMLAALIRLVKEFEHNEDVRVILSIHDSILCECPDHMAVEVGQTMRQIMEDTATELVGHQIPFLVEVEAGPSKGKLKGQEK